MTTGRPDGASRAWKRGQDLLLLFTDGVTDARNDAGVRLGEQPRAFVYRCPVPARAYRDDSRVRVRRAAGARGRLAPS